MDKLDEIFKLQKAFNDEIDETRDLKGISPDEWIQKLTLATMSELAELLAESNFKWWKNPKELNIDNIKEEIIDILHFFVSMCLRMGMDAEECYRIYIDKNKENFRRQHGESEKKGYEIKR